MALSPLGPRGLPLPCRRVVVVAVVVVVVVVGVGVVVVAVAVVGVGGLSVDHRLSRRGGGVSDRRRCRSCGDAGY